MRTVLFITYYFPPTGGPGSLRSAKFARYLPEFGWSVAAVRAANPPYTKEDPALLLDVASVLETVYAPYPELEARLNRLRRRRGDAETERHGNTGARGRGAGEVGGHPSELPNPPTTQRPHDPATQRLSDPQSRRPLAKVALDTAMQWLKAPDRAEWVGPAARTGRELAERVRPTCLYSSGPPHAGHMAAARLARELRLPWVADLRDPWVNNPFRPELPPLLERRDRRLEQETLGAATLVIANTEGARRDLLTRFPHWADNRVVVISNGFDEPDFADLPPSPPVNGTLTLAHIGALYGSRSPEALFGALAALASETDRPRLTLRLVGEVAPQIHSHARERGLEGVVEFAGTVPHNQAVAEMGRAHALVLVGNAERAELQVASKLFEYMRAGRPVVALTPETSEMARLLRGHNVPAFIAPPDDMEAVAGALRQVRALDWSQPMPAPDVAHLSRRGLTERLAETLDRAVEEHRGARS
jgi:glycosyltransferase involved in cell wall biosynthesis